jgi:hypothetical protein
MISSKDRTLEGSKKGNSQHLLEKKDSFMSLSYGVMTKIILRD